MTAARHEMRTGTDTDDAVRSERAERLALLTERRRAERTRELAHLQQTRPEQVSAYAPADFAADALRWAI